jgi:hypothetical protein
MVGLFGMDVEVDFYFLSTFYSCKILHNLRGKNATIHTIIYAPPSKNVYKNGKFMAFTHVSCTGHFSHIDFSHDYLIGSFPLKPSCWLAVIVLVYLHCFRLLLKKPAMLDCHYYSRCCCYYSDFDAAVGLDQCLEIYRHCYASS